MNASWAQGKRHWLLFLSRISNNPWLCSSWLGSFLPSICFCLFLLRQPHYTTLEITEVCLNPGFYKRTGDVLMPSLIHHTHTLLCKVGVCLGEHLVKPSSSLSLAYISVGAELDHFLCICVCMLWKVAVMKDIVFQQMCVVPRWETHDKSKPSQDTGLSRNPGQKSLLDPSSLHFNISLLPALVWPCASAQVPA